MLTRPARARLRATGPRGGLVAGPVGVGFGVDCHHLACGCGRAGEHESACGEWREWGDVQGGLGVWFHGLAFRVANPDGRAGPGL